MSNLKILAKIEKLSAKNKSDAIIKLLKKADKEDLISALTALGKIGDESSRNYITHYLDNEDADIRLTACKAALTINTEYMRTRVRHQLAMEKDADVKVKIQQAFNDAKEERV